MTEEHRARIAIFERPAADFTLRRTLELVSGVNRAGELMSTMSRFVLVARTSDTGIVYVRAETLEETFTVIGQLWYALNRDGHKHVQLDKAVASETEPLIAQALAEMKRLMRPAAAND